MTVCDCIKSLNKGNAVEEKNMESTWLPKCDTHGPCHQRPVGLQYDKTSVLCVVHSIGIAFQKPSVKLSLYINLLMGSSHAVRNYPFQCYLQYQTDARPEWLYQ